MWFQTKEETEEGNRRRNSKKGFAKMNKDRKMKDNIGGKMVQGNPKIIKESMEEGRSGKAESSTDKGDKEDDLTRTGSRDPMLTWSSPFSKILALDQAVADKLAKLLFGCCRIRPNLLGSPHGHELLVLDQRKG